MITWLENEGTENPSWACLCFSPLCHPEGPWTGNGSALPRAVIRIYKEVFFMVPGSQPAPYVLVSPCNYWWLMNNTSLYSSIYSRNRPKTQTTKTEIWGFWGCIFIYNVTCPTITTTFGMSPSNSASKSLTTEQLPHFFLRFYSYHAEITQWHPRSSYRIEATHSTVCSLQPLSQ